MKRTAKTKPQPKKTAEIDPRFAPVAKAFAHRPHVTSGRMMSAFGLRVNNKIFAMFPRGEFVVKLPKTQVDELVSAGKGRRFDPGHGRLMKEWVVISDGKADWIELAEQAFRFVKGG
jgi:hypothetical protein